MTYLADFHPYSPERTRLIRDAVLAESGVALEDYQDRSKRSAVIVRARFAVCWFARNFTGRSWRQIAADTGEQFKAPTRDRFRIFSERLEVIDEDRDLVQRVARRLCVRLEDAGKIDGKVRGGHAWRGVDESKLRPGTIEQRDRVMADLGIDREGLHANENRHRIMLEMRERYPEMSSAEIARSVGYDGRSFWRVIKRAKPKPKPEPRVRIPAAVREWAHAIMDAIGTNGDGAPTMYGSDVGRVADALTSMDCPHLGRPLTEWEAAEVMSRRACDLLKCRDRYRQRRARMVGRMDGVADGVNWRPWTYLEIADLWGVSPQRVEQIERQALDKLREALSDCV